jgi:hypothetical protein
LYFKHLQFFSPAAQLAEDFAAVILHQISPTPLLQQQQQLWDR